jgi:predicted outer membrane repeat protein
MTLHDSHIDQPADSVTPAVSQPAKAGNPAEAEAVAPQQTWRNWLAGLLAQRSLTERNGSLWLRFSEQYRRLRRALRRQLRPLPRRTRRADGTRRAWPWLGRIGLTLSGAALMLALVQAGNRNARANNILVVDGEVAITSNGSCSLIEAIANANDTGTGQPHADCAAGDPAGADVVTLPAAGNFELTAAHGYYYYGDTGLPLISGDVTIDGNDATILGLTSGSVNFRMFAVDARGHLQLNNTTVSGGNLVESYGYGGAIASYGEVTITGSTLDNNAAYNGGAIYSANGVVTITDSTLSGNSAELSGGALYTYHSQVTISGSTLSGNTTQYLSGGAIYQVYGTLNVSNSTLSGNAAGGSGGGANGEYGGGIRMYGTAATVSGSTISDNSAPYGGGGISAYKGTLAIANSTLSGNTTEDFGGGLYAQTIAVTVTNSTLTDNTAGMNGGGISGSGVTLTLARSLISGNSSASGRELFVADASTVNANSHNLFGFSGNGGTAGFAPGASDIVPADALAAILNTTLAANGGPTQTHALPPGSPAIDAAPSADCGAGSPTGGVDQRGQLRNANGDGSPSANECDVGAYELVVAGPTATPSLTPLPPTPTVTETPFPFPTDTPTPPATPGGELYLPAVVGSPED